jgi:hypothetical protein
MQNKKVLANPVVIVASSLIQVTPDYTPQPVRCKVLLQLGDAIALDPSRQGRLTRMAASRQAWNIP